MMRAVLAAAAFGDTIRGVNLGGWLVLEPWITPFFFEKANEGVPRGPNNTFAIVDEYTWRSSKDGSNDRAAMLVDHWNTWVTEDILETLANAGITHLRVPVGYWYFLYPENEEPVWGRFKSDHATALEQLKKVANEWMKPRGLQILLDLHTAPGSQNGFDNSGRRGNGTPALLNGNHLQEWAQAVDKMSEWAVANLDEDVLFGIEVLNEPAGFSSEAMRDAIKKYIDPKGYEMVRKHSSDLNVVFETGFMDFTDEPNFTESKYKNVWMDQHTYYCFGEYYNGKAMEGPAAAWPWHLEAACNETKNYAISKRVKGTWAFGGEWSLATTDCTIYLAGGMNNGCNMTAHPDCKYNATPSQHGRDDVCQFYNAPAEQMPEEYKAFLAAFARAQMDAFEASQGWFFWNFRTEQSHAPEWDYLAGLEHGWMPANAGIREPFCTAQSKPTTIFV
jgi:glucan 1,3-beta-glucosidase